MAKARHKPTRIKQAYTAAKRTGNLPGRKGWVQVKAAYRKLAGDLPRPGR